MLQFVWSSFCNTPLAHQLSSHVLSCYAFLSASFMLAFHCIFLIWGVGGREKVFLFSPSFNKKNQKYFYNLRKEVTSNRKGKTLRIQYTKQSGRGGTNLVLITTTFANIGYKGQGENRSQLLSFYN